MSDATEQSVQYEFDEAFQERIAGMFIRDTMFAMQTKDLVDPEYFTSDALRAVIGVAREHVEVYRSAPEISLMPMLIKDAIAAKRIRADTVPEIKNVLRRVMKMPMSNPKFVSDKVCEFARHRAIENAIMESVGLLEKNKIGDIEDRIKKAVAVGENDEAESYSYWEEIENRTKIRHDIKNGKAVRNGITSGYSDIDSHLYHYGWGRGELSCMMGPAKSGKSLSLGDFCKNASLAGYNVLYISLEVSKVIIADRIDAAISDTLMRELHNDPDAIESRVKKMHAKAGIFEMRDFPSGTMKPSQLRRLIESYRSKGINFDLIAVDYADIMAPEYRSDDLRESLRTIYIDLRALAQEYNVAMLTATQTNRDGAKASTAQATDVGDDWNKVRTVDILIGINATEAEKQAGEARLYWAISRNTEDGFHIRIKQDRARMKFIDGIVGKNK
jgi:replicative DNA helicase